MIKGSSAWWMPLPSLTEFPPADPHCFTAQWLAPERSGYTLAGLLFGALFQWYYALFDCVRQRDDCNTWLRCSHCLELQAQKLVRTIQLSVSPLQAKSQTLMCSFLGGLAKHRSQPAERFLHHKQIVQMPPIPWGSGSLWKEKLCLPQAKLPLLSWSTCADLHCNGVSTRIALKERTSFPQTLEGKKNLRANSTFWNVWTQFSSVRRLEEL